ncbi:hypothetical protein [Afifella sp. YEN Y35]|uniref:hypothetical protein n=1 Tax=Afifella sp. YEN Y35 TaxID=3388337 RepID=UPI0039E09026
MRKIVSTAAAAAFALPLLAPVAFAQDAGTPAAKPDQTQAAQPAAPGEQGRTPITVDSVVASVADSGNAADAISDTDIKQVGVVTIDERAGADAAARVDQAVADNRDKVTELRDTLSHHQQLGPRLREGGLDVTKVVAAQMMPSGDLLLFVRS